ncbi:phage integrase family protein [Curtobacterium sp. MCBD17_030]|uniref:phage integrase family protein n=1 Tax=Curtobacterium sp. MCBD17_030 TaxID=2175649 RepID=UPI0011B767A4|nr:phage integrase family protein [Curtobacterium sp. MCBD17_030]
MSAGRVHEQDQLGGADHYGYRVHDAGEEREPHARALLTFVACKARNALERVTYGGTEKPGRVALQSAPAVGTEGVGSSILDFTADPDGSVPHRDGMRTTPNRLSHQLVEARRACLLLLAAAVTYVPTFPADRWDQIRRFVLDASAEAAAASTITAERLLVVAAPYVDWVVNINGYPTKTMVVFHPVMVRRYVTRADVTWTDTTRRTYRSLLMRMSEALVGTVPLEFSATSPQSTAAPYDDLDLHLLESWATGQSTAARRRSAGVVLALCTGAGLKANELLQVRRRDITVDADGILVSVACTGRAVPLLARFEPLLLNAIANVAEDDWVFGSPKRVKHGISTLTTFLYDTDRGNEPDPVTTRMRNTWIITHLIAGTNMRALMTAAGVTKFEHLDQLVAHVPALGAASYRQQLRAEAVTR